MGDEQKSQAELIAELQSLRAQLTAATAAPGETRFRAVFEQVGLGLALVGRDGRVIEANAALGTLLGLTPAELRGRDLVTLIHPEDASAAAINYDALMVGEQNTYTAHRRYVRRDGRSFWARVSVAVVRGPDGQPLFALGMLEDVTDLRFAADKLRRAERLASIGTLAAGIAHEINNPLGLMLLDVDEGLEVADDPPRVRRTLQTIRDSVARCAHIVKSILQFARQEPTPRAMLDFNEPVRRALVLTREYARRRGVEFGIALADYLPPVQASQTELEQVVVNLVRNAVEACHSGGVVRLRTLSTAGCVELLVTDNGCGMSAEQRQRVFDPFYTTRQAEGGSGLGLSLCHGIVIQHGGSIEIESQLGAGTRVTVQLPAAPAS